MWCCQKCCECISYDLLVWNYRIPLCLRINKVDIIIFDLYKEPSWLSDLFTILQHMPFPFTVLLNWPACSHSRMMIQLWMLVSGWDHIFPQKVHFLEYDITLLSWWLINIVTNKKVSVTGRCFCNSEYFIQSYSIQ